MQVPKIYVIHPKPVQRCIYSFSNVFWGPINRRTFSEIGVLNKAKFCSEEDLAKLPTTFEPGWTT